MIGQENGQLRACVGGTGGGTRDSKRTKTSCKTRSFGAVVVLGRCGSTARAEAPEAQEAGVGRVRGTGKAGRREPLGRCAAFCVHSPIRGWFCIRGSGLNTPNAPPFYGCCFRFFISLFHLSLSLHHLRIFLSVFVCPARFLSVLSCYELPRSFPCFPGLLVPPRTSLSPWAQ